MGTYQYNLIWVRENRAMNFCQQVVSQLIINYPRGFKMKTRI